SRCGVAHPEPPFVRVQSEVFGELLPLIGLKIVLYPIYRIIVALVLQSKRVVILLPAYLGGGIDAPVPVIILIGQPRVSPYINITVHVVVPALTIGFYIALWLYYLFQGSPFVNVISVIVRGRTVAVHFP